MKAIATFWAGCRYVTGITPELLGYCQRRGSILLRLAGCNGVCFLNPPFGSLKLRYAPYRASFSLLGTLAILAVAGPPQRALALPIVGNAQTVVRDVKGKIEAELRTIIVDSDVFQDEEVATGPNSGTRIVFKDGTNLELGENSKLRLTKLVFDADPAKSEIAVKALTGVFRWTSGNLPSNAYHIATPVATIGIRGTSLEWIVGADGLTTVALAKGSITVTNSRGDSVNLEPNQATTVYPPDPDGSQLPPSAAGTIPPDILQVIWKMTATINLFDAPSVSDPHAGGTGFIEQTGGYDGRLNPNYFSPSFNNPGGPNVDPPPSPPPIVVLPLNKTTGGQGIDPTPSPGVTPPTSPTPGKVTANINFGGHTVGTATPVAVAISTAGLGFNVVIATVQMLNDTFNAFRYSGAAIGQSSADAPLAWLLAFVPPPGMPDQIFSATFEVTDALGNSWDWLLSGTEVVASIPEPSALALLAVGIIGLAWARRRRGMRGVAGPRCGG
jgi:hypothetical protein